MRVVVPGAGDEAAGLAGDALARRSLTYLRTSTAENDASRELSPGGLTTIRRGAGATTVVPLDREALRATAGLDVVVVEPFHEGTLAAQLMAALAGRAVRLTSISVGREIVHRYGTSADHDRAHGLDIGGLHERIARAVERAAVAS